MEKEKEIYKIYKPLRNKLRQLKLDDSLYVIWNYNSLLAQGKANFIGIEVPKEFLELDQIQKLRSLSMWNLELLTREIILNSPEQLYKPRSLRSYKFFSNSINKIKDMDGKIAETYFYPPEKFILLEMHRISHLQFPWQTKRPNKENITKYAKIFSEPVLAKLVYQATGLTIQEFYITAGALWGYFLNNIALNFPPKIELPEINQDKLDKFLSHFSCSIEEYKKRVTESRQINEKFEYTPKISRIFPILKMSYFGKESIVCPDPTLLFWRITDGLYYEIYKLSAFGNAFGPSFEKYIGEILESVCNKLKFYKEITYNSSHGKKQSIDWILDDESCVLFIECKTKRMQEDSKVELLDTTRLEEDLAKMADFIVQTYENISEYQKNKFTHFPFNESKKIYPLVVTLEEWFTHGPEIFSRLNAYVETKMKQNSLPINWLTDMPYTVCSVDEFEILVQVAEKVGICRIMSERFSDSDKEKRMWVLSTFLNEHFPEEKSGCRFLFQADFDRIFPEDYYKE